MTKTRILLFIIGVNAISWGGILLIRNLIDDPNVAASVAVPLIALGPLVMAVLLRLVFRENWAGAGLSLNFRGNGKWYAFAFAFPLMVIGLVYVLALAIGAGNWEPEMPGRLASVLKLIGIMVLPFFIASIGEEFGWRGYLEPNLNQLGGSTLTNHVIVGVVWGVWHFPLLILSSGQVVFTELVMVLMGCIALAVIYGQVRIRTASVWPCVLLHAASNTFNVSFAASKLMIVDEAQKGLVSLSSTSAAVAGTWILVAILFLRHQKDYS